MPGSCGPEAVWDRAGGCWWAAHRVPAGLGPGLRGIVGGPLEGADYRIRRCGGCVGRCDPLGPAEPVPPAASDGVARGDDVAAPWAVVWVLHEQGRQSPRRRGDVGAPATRVHLRRQHVQAGDAVPRLAGVTGAVHGRSGLDRPGGPGHPNRRPGRSSRVNPAPTATRATELPDVSHAYLPPNGPLISPEWAFLGSTRPTGGWMGRYPGSALEDALGGQAVGESA